MQRPGIFWRITLPTVIALFILLTGTGAFAQTLRIGDSNPWKYGKYVGSYVKLFYGSSSPAGQLPKVITVSSRAVVINANSLNVRSGPGTKYNIVGSTTKGATLKLISQNAGWYNVVLANGKTGWVSADYATIKVLNQSPTQPKPDPKPPVPEPKPPVTDPASNEGKEINQDAVVKGSVVNVRSGPATSYPVVFKITAGAVVRVTRENLGWMKLTTTDGKEGWAAGYLLSLPTVPPSRDDGNVPKEPPDTGSNPPDTETNPPDSGTEGTEESVEAGGKLVGITTETGADYEKVTITTDGIIAYTVYNLTNPRRLVFDLVNMDKASVPGEIGALGTWVGGIRIGQFSLQPLVTRVVIDLSKPAAYSTLLSDDKKTLTIELQEPSIKGKTIVIDAGHGGYDPGAIGVTGLREKEVNLSIALKVAELLTAQNANVLMTRNEDVFVPLADRSKKANEAQADIFVSIHANSSESSRINGTSTYYYAPSTNQSLYAQREAREKLATKIQNQLGANLGIKDLGVKQDNFSVLRNTAMPSVLVETAFLSYGAEEALLKTNEFREKAAKAIVQGIMEYFTQV